MQAVHFGAGNIGRGFIGETLSENGYHVDFVDVNEAVVDALNARQGYEIEFASEGKERKKITNVDAINNGKDPQAVVDAIAQADIVTTAIGPNILPYIAELIAKGIQKRQAEGNAQAIDVIACENMIGGSDFLKKEVSKYLTEDNASYIEMYIGFPNAAVDRIVPMQSHDDVLFVSVEPFKEWVVDVSMMKSNVKLDGVLYVDALEPYIERKLFSVNTGHATVAYTGAYNGYTTIGEAIQDHKILNQLERVLHETGALIVNKWQFDPKEHEKYIQKIITRFENPYISDEITRVARTPIRKLGYDERFIRPIRETTARSLDNDALIEVVGMIYYFNNPEDKESVQLQQLLLDQPLEAVVRQTTNLTDTKLIDRIVASVESYKK